VIGVGVNVSIDDEEFPEDLRWPATSLGGGATPNELRKAVDKELGRWVEAEPRRVLKEFGERDVLRGRPIAWEGGPDELERMGIAEGVDERGNLIVRGEDGTAAALGSGEVHLRLL
jgi:BirA family biotin operon repressor/biotin-[acetyl-CoA-carboxylase] ligase